MALETIKIEKEGKVLEVTERIYNMVYRQIGYAVVTEEVENEEVETDLEALKVAELKELAKERGVEGYADLKKAELIEEIKGL